jgi:hypothetical protein
MTVPATARRRPSTWVALALVLLAIAMIGFIAIVNVMPGAAALPGHSDDPLDMIAIIATVAAWLSILLTGAVLTFLRPRNPIGWLLLVSGISIIYTYFAPEYVLRVELLGWVLPGYQLVDWVLPFFERLGPILIAVWIPLLFPDGHLPNPRWRPIAWLIGLTMAVGIAVTFVTDNDEEFGRNLPNPTAFGGTAEQVADALGAFLNVLLLGFIVLALVLVVVRFRRSIGAERQQLKWFLGAVALVVISSIATTALFVLGVQPLADSFWLVNQISIGLVPIAIGIAVLRYRLYEIDRLISRTIGWATVTIVLVGAFSLLVLGSSAVLEPLTGGNTLAVAGSTLIVAALFAPLRGRVQRAVDRRFDRARYDGERLVGAFGERLRDEVDLETIRADVLATVDRAVRPASVGLWLRERAEGGR